jgi:translation initiation factor 2B subunit (eIF-2B alpha/beta/delta family)
MVSDDPGSLAARRLREVARDRKRGATELALRALAAVRDWAGPGRETLSESELRVGRALARRLAAAQPAMGALVRLGAELRTVLDHRPAPSRVLLRQWTVERARRIRSETAGIVRTAQVEWPAAGGRVVSLSRSSAVRRVLRSLDRRRRPREVVVLRSEPGSEGRTLARELRSDGVAARVVPDASGPREVARSDLMLIGADTVYRDGSVLHKVGTRPLARAAKRAGIPVVSLAGTSKWIERSPPRRAPPRLFDRTPAAWITSLWTELGPRRPEDVARYWTRARRCGRRRALR